MVTLHPNLVHFQDETTQIMKFINFTLYIITINFHLSGWWFGTCFNFHILGTIVPTDELIFLRGVGQPTNQLWCSAGSTFPPLFCRSQRPRPGRLAPHPRCGWPDAGRWRAMSLAQAQLEWTWTMDMNVANLTINHPRNIPRCRFIVGFPELYNHVDGSRTRDLIYTLDISWFSGIMISHMNGEPFLTN